MVRKMHSTAMNRAHCAYEVRNVLKILSPLTSLLPSVKNRETVESEGTMPLCNLYRERAPTKQTVRRFFMPSLSRFAQLLLSMNCCISFWKKALVFFPDASECISFGTPYIIPFLTQQPLSGVSLVLLNWKSVG